VRGFFIGWIGDPRHSINSDADKTSPTEFEN